MQNKHTNNNLTIFCFIEKRYTANKEEKDRTHPFSFSTGINNITVFSSVIAKTLLGLFFNPALNDMIQLSPRSI